jgi:hypothetical protein
MRSDLHIYGSIKPHRPPERIRQNKTKGEHSMKNYNIENKNVNYESNLTSERQAILLEKVIKENHDKKITVKRIWGDARSAWKKYKNNPSYTQIGHSQGSSHCMDNFHSTWAIIE